MIGYVNKKQNIKLVGFICQGKMYQKIKIMTKRENKTPLTTTTKKK